jgi:hypothetical protein
MGQGLMQDGNSYSACPQLLLIENIKLNLRAKADYGLLELIGV